MADLIDRQKIKAKFEPWLKVTDYSEGELNMLKAVLYEITIMPSAQPEPIKVSVDHAMTEEELKELKQKIADSPVILLPSAQPERKKPVFKTGESVYHVSYADGTGGFEKNKWADWTCPDCGWFVGEQYIPRRHNQQKCNYCAKCGCAIDWSDADMRGEQDE